MLTRMQPIEVIFGKFPRIIRDTAKALKKDIQVVISGGDLKLDKYLLDSLTDPIAQLVKNSADHGIESAARRAEMGKPKKGKIMLDAYMRDGSAIIEVADDGAGIDAQALRRKTLENGMKTEEELSAMTEKETFALIFEPGFSTASKVTNLSGRGVGMDIVKTNIERLGGSIEIDSEVGKGTVIRLKTPLTLSVIRTLIVTIGSAEYAVPECNIERIVRITGATPAKRLERLGDELVLNLNGRVIPVLTMDEIDSKTRGAEPQPQQLSKLKDNRGIIKCLVLKAIGKSFALLIDDAVETVQTLVKPLPVFLKNSPCYSSVAVLGNGNAIAILDAEGIAWYMDIKTEEEQISRVNVESGREDERQVIVFKCSGAEYFALDTKAISRIEAIDPKAIQQIGTSRFINIAGETIRVVKPESFAPVQKRAYKEGKLYLLTLKKCASPVGLLAGEVVDKVEGEFKLDKDRLYSEFIYGTNVFNEKILIFLNPAAILERVENDKQGKRSVRKAAQS
jgi:two-component system chemotaxis sensor kinase CheA